MKETAQKSTDELKSESCCSEDHQHDHCCSEDHQHEESLELTASTFKEWTVGLLEGVPSISKTAFIHLSQRIFLLMSNGTILTALALRMDKPGLELEEPEAIEMPEEAPPEEAEEFKAQLSGLKSMLKHVAEAVEEELKDFPEKEGRIVLEQKSLVPAPEPFFSVLLDESAALILSASDDSLLAELNLVLKGVSILLKSTDEPGATHLVSKLLDRLPEQRERIVEALRPLCSEEQQRELD